MNRSVYTPAYFTLPTGGRRLAYSAVGDPDSPVLLLCLPGLLETRASFDPLLHAAASVPGLRVMALDLCGRGDADPLPNDQGYAMSVYLDDVLQLLQHLTHASTVVPQVHLLGTSMGGLLAMYVASDPRWSISSLTLNDIGLQLPWLSIYGLYDSMKQAGRLPEPDTLAQQLHVRVGAVLAVQSPTHFDLPYEKEWTGMGFSQLLRHFDRPVRLVRAGESAVCSPAQVADMRQRLKHFECLEVVAAQHPAPFNATVCDFILQGCMRQPVASTAAPSEQHPPTGWWHKIMRRLNATKR